MALSLTRGRIKERPEDFVVEEIPAYDPSGAGDHLYVRFTKTDRTTLDAVHAIARGLGCDPRAAGFAGMKDRRAVTTQTASFQAPPGSSPLDLARRAQALSLPGIRVHEAIPHGHKIKPGHLAGNRFTIVIREIQRERITEVTRAFERVAVSGVPNAFGAQRFGRRGDNAARALAWLRGEERGPRDRRVLRLLWSSLQSAVFNAVLDARVRDGTWTTPLEGDLLKLRSSGGLFVCSDVQKDGERAATGELSPTGPIFGARMRGAEGTPGQLERRLTAEIVGADVDLSRTRGLGEGARRALRVWVEDLRWELSEASGDDSGNSPACVRVHFVLPKGAYATTVLGSALAIDETHDDGRARDDEEIPSEFTD
jgi:tRNA pseudouridine13 synthase